MLTPRPYQLDLVARARAAFTNANAVLAVLPTGGGKTVVGSMVVSGALGRGRRVLWLAHRRELIRQAASRLPGEIGVVMAGDRERPLAPVQVASIDTLLERDVYPTAELLVYDEAHHIVAATSRRLLERYPSAKVLGLTATPQRADKTGLGNVFDAMVQGPSVAELMADGHLVPVDVVGPTVAVQRGRIAEDPCVAWARYAPGRPGLLFARSVEESKGYVARMSAQGMRAAHVDGGTAAGMRDDVIERFRAGDIDVLCSVGVYTEGVDLPRAEVCMLARRVQSVGLYLQMVGRVMRPHLAKTRAIVIDLFGVAQKLGLPDEHRAWTLEGRGIEAGDLRVALTQCLQCGLLRKSTGARQCPRCGYMPPPQPVLTPMRQTLRAVQCSRPHASPDERQRAYQRWQQIAAEQGYKMGWAKIRYKQAFGRWPLEAE
jgi:DNA repair protein RadD